MSDEEKKAIDDIKRELTDEDRREYMNKWFADDLQTLVNLIEKQSKEIEELKEENEKYKNPPFFDEDKYTENDKIKAKIEEYENKIKKIRSKKLINEPEDTIVITRYAHYISVLQSLLEKE